MSTFIFKEKTPSTTFCELEEGDFFVKWKDLNKRVYLKTEEVTYRDEDGVYIDTYNAVQLVSGEFACIDFSEKVIKYNATITLEEA